jgi:glucuronate isomerase
MRNRRWRSATIRESSDSRSVSAEAALVGFNDDTRAFLSIPARHDVARRVDCSFLARLVAEHRIDEDEACEIASELANGLARKAYKL